jgi:hypothetical protein
MTRDEALEELKKPIYNEQMLRDDKEFVLKKFGFSEAEFEAIMGLPVHAHTDYPSYITRHYRYHERIMKSISPLTRMAKRALGIKRESKAY